MIFLLIYYVFANITTFLLFALDKQYAVHNRWRIPEIVLLVMALVGGAFGALLAMLVFHHKTLHIRFLTTVPFALALHILLLIILILNI